MTKSGKTLWQKEKLLVLSNFFFCHYVFKKAVCCRGVRKRLYDGGKGLINEITIIVGSQLINIHLNLKHEYTFNKLANQRCTKRVTFGIITIALITVDTSN